MITAMTDEAPKPDTDTDTDTDTIIKSWATWLWGFWFIRSIGGIVALLAIVPEFTDLDYSDVLFGLHSIVVAWSYWMQQLAELLSRIPYVPKISDILINAFLISLLMAPVLVGSIKKQFLVVDIILYGGCLLGIFLVLSDILARVRFGFPVFQGNYIDYLLYFMIFFCVYAIRLQYREYSHFRSAVWATIGAVIAVEFLFLVNGPDFALDVRTHYCAALQLELEKCAPQPDGVGLPRVSSDG